MTSPSEMQSSAEMQDCRTIENTACAPEPDRTGDWGAAALTNRRNRSAAHLAEVATRRQSWIDGNRYYYGLLERLLRFLVEPGKRVLSVRCGTGTLLAATAPKTAKGVDICPEIIAAARERHFGFEYDVAFPDTPEFLECFEKDEWFDYIIFNDVGDTVDLQRAFQNCQSLCRSHTRLLIVSYNPLWEPLVTLAETLGMKVPRCEQNWLSAADVRNLLTLTGFETLGSRRIVLCPKYIPLISSLLNRFCARLPGVNALCMTEVHMARLPSQPLEREKLAVSVIIPCKNERGNIESAVSRIPSLAGKTEIIFCDDNSADGTVEEVKRMQELHRERNIRLEHGPGVCKARNVWTGFNAASGDILLILDADLTTMPEELPYFVDTIASGRAEFINGSRLIYPVPRGAMKGINMLGNKFFSLAFSYLLNQRVKDTLCGTKVLWRRDWERMQPFLGTWGIEDRWGDYELLFGACKLNLRIIDLPVHYQERIYGSTKMTKVFQNGLIMLHMCWHGFLRLRLGY